MCQQRMIAMTGFNQKACANRLLAQELLDNSLLHSIHQLDTEVADDVQVYAAVHQAKGIGRAYHAIEFRQVLETVIHYTDSWQVNEVLLPGLAKVRVRIDEDQLEMAHRGIIQ